MGPMESTDLALRFDAGESQHKLERELAAFDGLHEKPQTERWMTGTTPRPLPAKSTESAHSTRTKSTLLPRTRSVNVDTTERARGLYRANDRRAQEASGCYAPVSPIAFDRRGSRHRNLGIAGLLESTPADERDSLRGRL